MISIIICRDMDGRIINFTVKGHAGFDEPGKDIVCSAVSVLAQTIVLGLKDVLKLNADYIIEEGYLKCNIPVNINREQRNRISILLDTMYLGFKGIQEGYPGNIELIEGGACDD